MFYLIYNGAFLKAVLDDSQNATLERVHGELGQVVSAAMLGDNNLFYITQQNASELVKRHMVTNESSTTALPRAATKIMSSHNKIYALCGEIFVGVDPLSSLVEEFALPEKATDFGACSTGFVFALESGNVCTFQFGVGCEPTGATAGKLLGQTSRRFLVASKADELVSVPLEGAHDVIEAPINVSSAVQGCDDTSGKVVVATDDGKFFLLSDGGKKSAQISGVDIATDTPFTLVSPAIADEVEDCLICFCELSDGDAITLDCGHAFHVECIQQCLDRAEEYLKTGTKIAFNMAMCPGGCGRIVRHAINKRSTVISERFRDVRALAVERAVTEYPSENPSEVIDKFLYYVCNKCQKPFWGGNKDCAATMGGEPKNDPASLICEKCNTDFVCPTHGRDLVVYKCMYCCNPATQLSFGTRRLCDRCVDDKNTEVIPCPGAASCPLGGDHPEGAYPIGCIACMENLDVDKIALPKPKEPEA